MSQSVAPGVEPNMKQSEFDIDLFNERIDQVAKITEQLGKMMFVTNGGALIAVLASISQLYSAETTEVLARSMVWAAAFFFVGLFCAIGVVFWQLISLLPLISLDYMDQQKRERLRRQHRVLRLVSGMFFLLSMLFFLAGAFKSYWTLV